MPKDKAVARRRTYKKQKYLQIKENQTNCELPQVTVLADIHNIDNTHEPHTIFAMDKDNVDESLDFEELSSPVVLDKENNLESPSTNRTSQADDHKDDVKVGSWDVVEYPTEQKKIHCIGHMIGSYGNKISVIALKKTTR